MQLVMEAFSTGVKRTERDSDYSFSSSIIKVRRLEWLGHVVTMDETRAVKKLFEEKIEGRRGRGRPRLRWIDDVEEDIRKLGVKRWRRKALDREEWASIIKEAKAKL